MIFDTHAHYDDIAFDIDRDNLLLSMKDNSIGNIVCVGANFDTFDLIKELTHKYDFMYSSYGVHPENADHLTDETFPIVRELLLDDKAVAVGEIGLDYHYDSPAKEIQKDIFIKQLQLAAEYDLPVIIHSRDAAKDTFDILNQFSPPKRGVVHCFSYSVEMAQEYIKMGYFIGIGGIVTFKNGKKLKEVVEDIPLEKLVLETDCPYLSPEPYRGQRNSSLYLPSVIKEIAAIKHIDEATIVSVTESNAKQLYYL